MTKIKSVLSRYRLMLNVLALVFVLSTFAAPAAADPPMCESGCWSWNQQQGCVNCQRCCWDATTGTTCSQASPEACGQL